MQYPLIIDHIQTLGYTDSPDYNKLIKMIEDFIKEKKIDKNEQYDWEASSSF